jgi:Recombination endonuclease VII
MEEIGPKKQRGRPRSEVCTKCGEADLTKFYYLKGKRKSICKKCDIEDKSRQQKANPEAARARLKKFHEVHPGYMRSYNLKKEYGISEEDYQTIFESQFGLCAICGQAPKDGKFHTDHCHTSNVVRGLLCTTCNLMLGLAKDNPEILIKAARYLKLHST